MSSERDNKHDPTENDAEVRHRSSQVRVRRTGLLAIVCAAVLAGYAVFGGVLHSTVLHLLPDSPEREVAFAAKVSPAACTVYWLLFALTILLALYMAMLDLRIIRALFTAQRRELMMQATREALIRGARRPEDLTGDTESLQ